jgi:dTDP-N-acetylfucosamine:lipid II N-acetylfucosaminyltransferase
MNVHLMADERFIDDFIETAELVAPGNNRYLVQCTGKTPSKVRHPLAEPAPVGSAAFRNAMRAFSAPHDRFFVHWLSYDACRVVLSLPANATVGAFFWGGDFVEGPISYHRAHLYGPLTRAYVDRYEVLPDPAHHVKWRKKIGAVANRLIFPWKEGARLRLKRRAIARLNLFCHFNPHDFAFVRRHFPTGAAFRPFFYGAGYDALPEKPAEPIQDGRIRLLLGNSATSTNNHLDAFALLEKLPYRDRLDIICPLSYGNPRYADFIAQRGAEMFGTAFRPLREMMPREAYFELLQQLDATLMFHHRGQGAGNLNVLFLMGKKIFLQKENPLTPFYHDLGVHFSDPGELPSLSVEALLRPLSAEEQSHNKAAVYAFFHPEKKIANVRDILT